MKLINFNNFAYLPHFILKQDLLDFENVEHDSESIIIPFTSEISDNLYFEHIKEILENQLRYFYTDEYWKDCEIQGSYSLVICKNIDVSYGFQIQFVDKEYYCDTAIEVELNSNERQILKSIIDKAFNSKHTIENIRKNVAYSFSTYVSESVLNKLKLVSDSINGNRYNSAWITDDNQCCIIANVNNISDSKCPVEIVKFGC